MLFENIKLAFTSIKANKMRTFLTMLGIIIGISSVITIIGLGNGIKNSFNQDISSLGMGKIYIMVKFDSGELKVSDSDMLTDSDIDAIYKRYREELLYIQPYYVKMGTANSVINKNKSYKTSITGVVSGYDKGSNVSPVYGRFINQNDVNNSRNVIVIDNKFATEVFGAENAVGKSVDIQLGDTLHTFVVVGVYKQSSAVWRGNRHPGAGRRLPAHSTDCVGCCGGCRAWGSETRAAGGDP